MDAVFERADQSAAAAANNDDASPVTVPTRETMPDLCPATFGAFRAALGIPAQGALPYCAQPAGPTRDQRLRTLMNLPSPVHGEGSRRSTDHHETGRAVQGPMERREDISPVTGRDRDACGNERHGRDRDERDNKRYTRFISKREGECYTGPQGDAHNFSTSGL